MSCSNQLRCKVIGLGLLALIPVIAIGAFAVYSIARLKSVPSVHLAAAAARDEKLIMAAVVVTLAAFGGYVWSLSRSMWGPLTMGLPTVLAQSNVVGVLVGNDAGELLHVNDAFLNMFGYTRAEFESHQVLWDALLAPESRTASQGLHAQLARLGATPAVELEYLRKDGTRVPILMGLAALDRHGRRVIGFVLDISRRRAAEDAARTSEARLQTIVNSLDDYVIELDRDGNILNIWTHNEAKLERPKEEFLGCSCSEILGRDAVSEVLETVARVLATGRSEERDTSAVMEGQERWYHTRFRPLKNAGVAQTVCLVVQDITRKKLAEAQ